MPNIAYSKLLDPVSDIISLMESLMRAEFGATSGDQRECLKRIHAYSWGLHTLVMDVITSLGIEHAATRPAVLERFHALNDPIKLTLGNLAAGFDGALSIEQHRVIAHVRETAQSIEQMIINIWHYSLLQHDMLEFDNNEFDGSALIQRVKSVLNDMDMEVPPARMLVIGDETLLSYAFAELARNVWRHSGVKHVNIETQDFGYRVDFTIRDHGNGFRLADKQAAFLPFWQASVDNPGLGLGLHLARAFIEGSGGRIAIGSAPTRGTLVKVSLDAVP